MIFVWGAGDCKKSSQPSALYRTPRYSYRATPNPLQSWRRHAVCGRALMCCKAVRPSLTVSFFSASVDVYRLRLSVPGVMIFQKMKPKNYCGIALRAVCWSAILPPGESLTCPPTVEAWAVKRFAKPSASKSPYWSSAGTSTAVPAKRPVWVQPPSSMPVPGGSSGSHTSFNLLVLSCHLSDIRVPIPSEIRNRKS